MMLNLTPVRTDASSSQNIQGTIEDQIEKTHMYTLIYRKETPKYTYTYIYMYI